MTAMARATIRDVNQHYIPKFILEGFVDLSDLGNRGVWTYKVSERKWSKRPTRRTASLDDFYSLVDLGGDRDDAVENYLRAIETPMAVLLSAEIAVRRSISPPRPHDLFVTFCSQLICRNP